MHHSFTGQAYQPEQQVFPANERNCHRNVLLAAQDPRGLSRFDDGPDDHSLALEEEVQTGNGRDFRK